MRTAASMRLQRSVMPTRPGVILTSSTFPHARLTAEARTYPPSGPRLFWFGASVFELAPARISLCDAGQHNEGEMMLRAECTTEREDASGLCCFGWRIEGGWMNESRTVFGAAMAVGGALLLSAVVFLICLVLDLSAGLIVVLMLAGAAAGAWYGWRLARGAKLGGSTAGGRRHR